MNWKNAIAATLATLIGTVTPAFAQLGYGSVATLLTGIGLPQILIWVLAFAVSFAVISKILSKAPATLISIVVGFLALMAAPAALISVIATMSTSLIVLGIGLIVLIALLTMAGTRKLVGKDKEGVPIWGTWLTEHSTATAAVLIVLAAIIFVAAGGLPLIGIPSIPVIGMGTWLLIIVGIGVLWMLSEAK